MMMPMLVLLTLVIVSLGFTLTGIRMHQRVNSGEDRLHALQDSYFTLSKAERDGAPTGSELNKQLVQIQQYPSSLLQLKLVGVGKILTGIFGILLGILMVLFMMPKRLAEFMKGGQN